MMLHIHDINNILLYILQHRKSECISISPPCTIQIVLLITLYFLVDLGFGYFLPVKSCIKRA